VVAGYGDGPLGPVAARPSPGLTGRRYTARGCTVLVLSGEVDVASALELRLELAAAVDASGTRVVVDLTSVGFMDCAGVGELVRALRRTGWARGSICLANPTRSVRRILELTSAGSVLPVYDSVDDAVAAAGA
jgi:anti-sigma B factor antagonist